MVSLKDMMDMQYGTENERRILLTASLARWMLHATPQWSFVSKTGGVALSPLSVLLKFL
jgi:hypothetical protein